MTRKEQITALIAEGKTHQEIASLLGIHVETVRYHIYNKKQTTMREMVKFLFDRAKAEDKAKELL